MLGIRVDISLSELGPRKVEMRVARCAPSPAGASADGRGW